VTHEEEKTHLKLESRIDSITARLDEQRFYLGSGAIIFTVVFGVLTIVLAWNTSNERDALTTEVTNEKAELRDFKAELLKSFGKAESPDLKLLSDNSAPLDGQELPTTFQSGKKNTPQIRFGYIVENVGNGATDAMWEKIYTKEPLVLGDRSSDEVQYNYEAIIYPADLDPSVMPGGGFSFRWTTDLDVTFAQRWTVGKKYDALLKVYYGKGKMAQAHVVLLSK
jgi:hypothetical protein